jgi:hypothetical protein
MVVELVTRAGRYTPTADDVLWLARAVEAEGPPRVRVAQTLVNGFLWARAELDSGRTLAEWVRAYSQPVNPAWMPGGTLYQAELARAATPVQKEQVRAKGHRRQREHATRVSFSRDTQRAVEAALTRPPDLPGAVDFAAPWVEHDPPWVPFTPAKQGENRFWSRPGAVGWTGYVVDGAQGLPSPEQSGWWAWVCAIAGASLLWWSLK